MRDLLLLKQQQFLVKENESYFPGMSSKRKSQPTKIGEQENFFNMFPAFSTSSLMKSDSDSEDIERLKILQQECLQSLLFQQQQQQHLQNLSHLNELMKPMQQQQQQQKSVQDTLKCLKSLQLARSLETER